MMVAEFMLAKVMVVDEIDQVKVDMVLMVM